MCLSLRQEFIIYSNITIRCPADNDLLAFIFENIYLASRRTSKDFELEFIFFGRFGLLPVVLEGYALILTFILLTDHIDDNVGFTHINEHVIF